MKKLLLTAGVLSLALFLSGATLFDGSKAVTSAGTAEPLSPTSIECVWAVVQAKTANVGNVFVGASTVSSSRGVQLTPGDSMYFPLITRDSMQWYDLADVYVDAATNGDGVTFLYLKRD